MSNQYYQEQNFDDQVRGQHGTYYDEDGLLSPEEAQLYHDTPHVHQDKQHHLQGGRQKKTQRKVPEAAQQAIFAVTPRVSRWQPLVEAVLQYRSSWTWL